MILERIPAPVLGLAIWLCALAGIVAACFFAYCLWAFWTAVL